MPLLTFERVSFIFRPSTPLLRQRTSQHVVLRAARNISWTGGATNAEKKAEILSRPGRRLRRSRSGVVNSSAKKSLTPKAEHVQSAEEAQQQEKADEQVTINWFEEDEGPDPKRRKMDLGDIEGFEGELEKEEKEVDDQIEDLEKDIERIKLPKELPEAWADELFSKEERQKVVQSLEHNFERLGELPHRLIATEDMRKSSLVFLANLNESLDQASVNPSSDKARIQLWRWYSRSKIYIPDIWKMMPDAAWDLLWISQSEESITNSNRASHLKILAEDMVKAGRKLTQEQRYGRLEGKFLEGEQEKALQEWENALKSGDAGNPEFLELGIRMYAYNGNLSRATDLLDVIFKLHTNWNPRIILPIISACINKGTTERYNQARALYLRLKQLLDSDMTMADYDAVTLDFLRAGQTEYALAVFRDMMLSGEEEVKSSESLFTRIAEQLGSFKTTAADAQKTNSMNLDVVAYMPKKFQNKFFYAKWIRKLISSGEVDAAAQVVELMYERGVKPDARHVNGLIGAWLRLDTSDTRKKAEEMAWAMIQTRLDYVHNRKINPGLARSIREGLEHGVAIPTWISRPTPQGTIETFCILAKYYLEKEMFANLRHLRNLLVYAEISMNSVFMNQLLYADLRYRTHIDVWARFQVMSRTVMPDMETWICLWACMKHDLVKSKDPQSIAKNMQRVTFPRPRQLFAFMIKWFSGLDGQQRKDALEDIEIDTYNDIVRCFLVSHDLAGAFVAMRTLTTHLDVYPQAKTVRMLLLQISRMQMSSLLRLRRQNTPDRQYKAIVEDNMKRTTEVLNLITQHRRELLTRKGAEFDTLDELQQAEESLRTLLQFLFTILKRRQKRSVVFQGLLNVVIKEMGVELLDADETMALVV